MNLGFERIGRLTLASALFESPVLGENGADVRSAPRKNITKLSGADLLVFTAKQSAPLFISRVLAADVQIGTYACIVPGFLVDLVIAFIRRVRYTWPTKRNRRMQ